MPGLETRDAAVAAAEYMRQDSHLITALPAFLVCTVMHRARVVADFAVDVL